MNAHALVPGMQNLYSLDESIPSKVLELQTGDELFRANEESPGLFMLEEGCIKLGFRRSIPRGRVPHDEFVTKLVSPGEFFSLHVLKDGPGKAYFAQAVRPSKVVFYPKEYAEKLLKSTPPLIRSFLEQALRDVDQYQSRAEVHHLATVEQKISSELLRLAQIFGEQRSDGTAISLSLTRNEIAQLADTINESMSRYLTRFQNRGWLEVRGREILLKNLEELKALANSP